jgi:ATP-binding cassette, subfamily B, multidrug efflux pump
LKKQKNKGVLSRVMVLAKPFKGRFISTTVLAIILALLAPARPKIIQLTVDNYIIPANSNLLSDLLFMTMLLIGILLLESFFRYLFIYSANWLGQTIIQKLRTTVFNHITRLRLQYFDKTPIGTSTTRTINDVETINDIFAQGIITIIADLLTIIAIISIMFWEDWRLTLVTLSVFPVLLLSTYIFKEKVKKAFQVVRNQLAKMNAFLQEHISGMKVVQIFNAEEREMAKFRKINAEYTKANINTIWYYSIFFPVIEILTASSIGLMVWYGANSVIRDETSLGVLLAFIIYLNMLFRPVRMLADKFNTVQMGLVAANRVFSILDRKEVIENKGTFSPASIKGDIRFENVWFAYDDENYVLKDINFKLKQGQTVALVGATGSGKTSIINTMNRYYEIQKGKILIDDVEISEYELSNLRSHIGNVLQDVFLFSGTILENITLRDGKIPMEKVIESAKICGIHDFIMKLPGGYQYNVMERGAMLSHGQRQLISFIRALIFDPAILILDEATSSIDRESEILIQNAIDKLISNRTSIVIAHRLSTIQNADLIIVMDQGEIKECGNHTKLIAANGFYKKLYDMQFKKSKVA